jgi:hypothetical protein
VIETFKRLAVEPLRLLFEPTPQFSPILAMSAAIYLIPLLLLRSRPELLLWILLLDCVVGFAFVLDITRTTRHLEEIRHTILASLAICALIPAMLAAQRPLLRNALPALVALACLGPLALSYSHFAENYRRFGSYFAEAKNTDEPIVFSSEPKLDWWSDVMLLAASHYSGVFPRTVAMIDQPASPQLVAQLHHWREFWFVWETPPGELQNVLPGARIVSQQVEPYVASVARVRWTDATTEPAP